LDLFTEKFTEASRKQISSGSSTQGIEIQLERD